QIDAFLAGLIPKVTDPNGFISLTQLNQNGNIVSVTRDQMRYIVNGPGAAKIFGTPFGNATRGSEIGPMLNNLNLGIVKNFKLRENVRLQLRMDAFNALNHPNPGVGFIAPGLGIPNFDITTAGSQDGFNDRGGIQFARREIQVGAKVIF